MRRDTIRVGAQIIAGVLLVGLVAYLFWPGSLSPDSISFMQQAASGTYKMGHPPFFAMVWHLFYRFYGGPEVVLLINLSLFVLGTLLIFVSNGRTLTGVAISSFIVLFPPILGILGAVWLDVTMAGLFLCGLGLFSISLNFHKNLNTKYCLQILCLMAIFAAIFVRYNAAAAAIPLLAFIIASHLKIKSRATVSYMLSFIICTGLFYATKMGAAEIVAAKRYPEHVIFLFDLAGISVKQHKYLIDARVYPGNTLHDLENLYHPRSVLPLQIGQQIHGVNLGVRAKPFAGVAEGDRVNLLFQNWRSAVWTYPMSYLEHRLEFFSELIGLSGGSAWASVYYEIVPNEFGIKPRTVPGGYLKWIMSFADEGLLFRPYLYLIGLSFLLVAAIAFPTERSGLVIALVLSGYAHMALLFISAVSPDFRYSHWTIVACFVAAGLRLQDQLARSGFWRSGRDADLANGTST